MGLGEKDGGNALNTVNPETEYRTLLESKGIPLQGLGVAETALGRDDALRAVDLLHRASIAILGGDVYFKKATRIESTYDSWHSDRIDGEDHDSFVSRSCLDSKNYIEKFPSTGDPPLFVLVIDL
jgi:hypothetical protein